MHKEKPKWLHISGDRSESEHIQRGNDWNVKIKTMRAQIRRKLTTEGQTHWIYPGKTRNDGR